VPRVFCAAIHGTDSDSDGSLLLLGVDGVLVDGQRLEGVGVIPTIEAPFTVEYAQGKNPQLEHGVVFLSRSVRG
jgi:carboxyl-terminal processing protease